MNRFQIMELYKKEITSAFEIKNKNIFTEEEINTILENNRESWKLPKLTSTQDFLLFLFKNDIINDDISINFPQKTVERYLFKTNRSNVDLLSLVSTFYKKEGYFSHYTAAFIHDLTENIVKTIYYNKELSPKAAENNELRQESIDKAFSKPVRETNNYSQFNNRKIVLLNGRFTNDLGVINLNNKRVTNIERTLIDIAVRPNYSGGIYEVLNIYKNAKGAASVNKIYSFLKKLNYIYPYHQVIGFYLERAGFKENAVKLMERFPIKYNFYLKHDMKSTNFSYRWKLYYPRELDA